MGPFISNLSTLTSPLRELLKEHNRFKWYPAHQEAFIKIKDSICSEVTLTYSEPAKETILQVDASMKGLGAELIQDCKPITFASKALSDVEARYANIERELLAVVLPSCRQAKEHSGTVITTCWLLDDVVLVTFIQAMFLHIPSSEVCILVLLLYYYYYCMSRSPS